MILFLTKSNCLNITGEKIPLPEDKQLSDAPIPEEFNLEEGNIMKYSVYLNRH